MEYVRTIDIDAPPDAVGALVIDVERWPSWTPTMSTVHNVGAVDLAVGARFRVQQPRLPAVTWTVTAYEPGRSFSWESITPGSRAEADHAVAPRVGGGSTVTLRYAQTGPLGGLVGRLMGGLVRRYVDTEAESLRRRAEGG